MKSQKKKKKKKKYMEKEENDGKQKKAESHCVREALEDFFPVLRPGRSYALARI